MKEIVHDNPWANHNPSQYLGGISSIKKKKKSPPFSYLTTNDALLLFRSDELASLSQQSL